MKCIGLYHLAYLKDPSSSLTLSTSFTLFNVPSQKLQWSGGCVRQWSLCFSASHRRYTLRSHRLRISAWLRQCYDDLLWTKSRHSRPYHTGKSNHTPLTPTYVGLPFSKKLPPVSWASDWTDVCTQWVPYGCIAYVCPKRHVINRWNLRNRYRIFFKSP